MSVLIIACNLKEPNFDYQPFYDALAVIDAVQLQDSTWGVRTASTSTVIFDYLWPHMYTEKDRMFVVPFNKHSGYKSKNAINPLKDV
jgi:hypothetical protein